VVIKTINTFPSGSSSPLPGTLTFSVTCQGDPYVSVTLAELEISDGGSSGNIISGSGPGWSSLPGFPENTVKTGLTTDGFGRVTETLTLNTGDLDDGDVVRIQCWQGPYGTGTLKAQIDLVGATLTVELQDRPGTPQSSTASSGNAADGKLYGRVTFGGSGVNGVPLLLEIRNSDTANHDYLFESRAVSTSYPCPYTSDPLLSKTTATVSGTPGVAEQDVFWHCPTGQTGTPSDGTFRIYWDRDVNNAITAADRYGEVTQTTPSGPIRP
jgi:hypothetical protein